MGLAYIIPVNAAEGLYNIVTIGPGSAPPRPHPTPPGGPVDPGYGIDIPVDPGYGYPIGGPPRPGHDLPPFPSHPIVIPSPPNVPSHPIVLPPTQPGGVMPPGSGLVVPLPADVAEPAPPANTPADHEPYVIWFGPGTVASVVWLPPIATPKKK